MTNLTLIDWLVCGGYLAAVFGLGLWFSGKQTDNEAFFVGSRRMHWVPIGLSVFAGMFSALSYVGLPSEGAYGDWHTFLGIMFIPLVACPIVGWLFVPLYHRVGQVSGYAYLERRFHRAVRLAASLLYIGYATCWMGNMLVAVGVILQVTLGVTHAQTGWLLLGVGAFATLYTTMGGVKAVIWTDVLQAFALGGGMLLILLMTVGRIDGGWTGLWDTAVRYDKFAMFDMTFDVQRENFISACAFGFFVYVAGYAIQFKEAQRYVSMPDVASARRALAVNGVMIAVVCFIFFLVGTAMFAYYHHALPEGAAAGSGFPPQVKKPDQLLPYFVTHVLTVPGLVGVLVAGLFAAAMSSVDSGINALTASVVYDWLAGRQITVRVSRLLCTLFGAGAVAVALVLHQWQFNVFDMVIGISGAWLGGLLGVFLLGMLVRRATTGGAVIGLVTAGACLAAVMYWNLMFGWWYSAVTCLPTFAIGWAASYLFAPPRREQVENGLVIV